MLPFTHAQFLEVFAHYNMNVWPAQVLAYVLGLAIVVALSRPSARAGRFVAAGVAAMWLWTGIAYHGLHFSEINNAAFVFAALFAIQALLISRAGVMNALRFGPPAGAAAWLGWGLIGYALVLYPLLGLWAGLRYPQMPMFGITPCPVTIFTFGVFLLATTPVSRWLLVIPVVWSLIGGSAAFMLQVPQDWLLLFSGLSVLAMLRRGPRAKLGMQAR